MTTSSKQPLFIVAPLRAGTTFLRLLLGMHPSVCIFGEFEEAVDPLGSRGWVQVADYLKYLDVHRAFAAKQLRPKSDAHDYRELVLDLWRQLSERTDKPILGASIHSHFERCPDLWPKAKYIHLLRDPRDVARSCVGMGWVGNAYWGTDYWSSAEQRWDVLVGRTEPRQRFEVRYEQLVREPEQVLRQICEFLEIEYDPVMLEYPQYSTYGPPDAALAEQWRRKLAPQEVEWIESKVSGLMEKRGYERVTKGAPPSPPELTFLRIQNRLGRARFSIRRFGLGLWLRGRVSKLAPQSDFHRKTQLRVNEIVRQQLR